MDIRVSLDGAAGLLLVSVPWLLLVLVAWWGRARRAGHTVPAGRDDAPSASIAEPLGIMTTSASDNTGLSGASGDVGESPPHAGLEMAPVLSQQEQEDTLRMAVEAAKSARDDPQLARSSVELGRLLLARSARPQASVLLQGAVMAAGRAKLPVVHAEARIELAEIALAEGDLTSACEHWQMAKLMFHEMGRRSDQDRMANLMRVHRCPTDWILTNF
jgi:hypothetical protein